MEQPNNILRWLDARLTVSLRLCGALSNSKGFYGIRLSQEMPDSLTVNLTGSDTRKGISNLLHALLTQPSEYPKLPELQLSPIDWKAECSANKVVLRPPDYGEPKSEPETEKPYGPVQGAYRSCVALVFYPLSSSFNVSLLTRIGSLVARKGKRKKRKNTKAAAATS